VKNTPRQVSGNEAESTVSPIGRALEAPFRLTTTGANTPTPPNPNTPLAGMPATCSPPPPMSSPSTTPKTPGIAIASLVCGIAGVLTGPLTGIPAIITGHLALGKIKKAPATLSGSGKATTGLILGYTTSVVYTLIALIIVLATPPVLKALELARIAENTNNARQVKLTLDAYAFDHDGEFPAALAELESEGLVHSLSIFAYKDKDKALLDWTYHPGYTNTSSSTFIILASPETFERRSVPSRIVGRVDGSVHVISEVDYQSQITGQSP
jgi:competence protein ComGC